MVPHDSKAQTWPVHTTPWGRFASYHLTPPCCSCLTACSSAQYTWTVTLLPFYHWQYTWTVTMLPFYHWQYTRTITLLPFYHLMIAFSLQTDLSVSTILSSICFRATPRKWKGTLTYASSLQSKTLLLICKVSLALNFILEKGMMQGSKRIDKQHQSKISSSALSAVSLPIIHAVCVGRPVSSDAKQNKEINAMLMLRAKCSMELTTSPRVPSLL